MDRLLLRLFEEEEDLHIYLLLDATGSMRTGRPPKIEYAQKVAAALAYIGLANLDRVSIVPFGGDAERRPLPAARGKGRIFRVFDFLRQVAPRGETHLRDAAQTFVAQHKRAGLSILVSDLYDPDGWAAALDLLRYHKFEPFTIHVFDQREARPDFKGDLELLDCETGAAKTVTVSPAIAAAFAAEHERYLQAIERFCTQRAMPYFRAPTAVPFDELVLQVLRRGGLVS
jgi:uncharacterized protein (DUF58 family)